MVECVAGCQFNLFTGAHGGATTLVESSSLALYKTEMLSNRVGILLPSDLEIVTESLKTVNITDVYVSSRTLMKDASFIDNGNRQGIAPGASVAGDMVSFDSTIIYKDDNTKLNAILDCGGGKACTDSYKEATFQPLACAGKAPTTFLAGNEAWIKATQQVSLICLLPTSTRSRAS